MKYIGLHSQKSANNIKSILLLVMFPVLLLILIYLFMCILTYNSETGVNISFANQFFIEIFPYVILIVGVWFIIAYFSNTYIIKKATGAEELSRKDNKRVYNLVENLCMSVGMPMPKINILNDDSLNAYASGINNSSYTVTLSKGIIEKLDDEELEGVIAHELSHIRNRDVRLMIVSIIFVGIFAFLMQLAFRGIRISGLSRSRNDKGSGLVIILVILILAAIGYFFSLIFRFAISRKREYLADASAAEMTKKPWALASALRKISTDSQIEAVTREDVAQLFIEHPNIKKKKSEGLSSIFATHPPIKKRIQVLEQF